jgi:hypothetical protein
VPGAIADVAGKDVAAKTTEALRMDNVKTSAELKRSWQSKCKYGRESVGSPGRNRMEVDAGYFVAFDPVGKDMHFVLFRKPAGQLCHVPAVTARAVIIVHDIGDFHAGWR